MKTGKVEFVPDYKSRSPRLPKNFGLMEEVCADGQHRFLPDAPRCGCGKTQNLNVEHHYLQLAVVETCSAYCASVIDMEENGWPTTMSKDEWHYQHLTKQTAMIDAYKALHAFESEHGIK